METTDASTRLEQIQSLLGGQNDGSSSLATPFGNILDQFMPMLQLLLVLGIVMTVVIVVYFIVNTVQKQRQHAAIMRIDKNLQKLVDLQQPDPVPVDNNPSTDPET